MTNNREAKELSPSDRKSPRRISEENLLEEISAYCRRHKFILVLLGGCFLAGANFVLTTENTLHNVERGISEIKRDLEKNREKTDERLSEIDNQIDENAEKTDKRLDGIDSRLSRIEGRVGVGVSAPAEVKIKIPPREDSY